MSSDQYTEEHAKKWQERPPIEAWPNQFSDRDYEIRIEVPEFTCICPRTGLPDFATVTICYTPDALCMELKSLKQYMHSYREMGVFHENVANLIRDDIIKTCQPRQLSVTTDFNVRGGLHTVVSSTYEGLR
jgi:7-cyano-7-deazaguanine reductase